jgi:hypothetical protein
MSCKAIRSKRNPSMWYSWTQYLTESMKIAAHHGPFRCRFIAGSGAVREAAVGVVAVVVTRYDLGEIAVGRSTGVVVNDVHHHGDTGVMQSHDHLFELVDAYIAVVRITGIGAFRNVEVLGVISPVEVVVFEFGFVNGTESQTSVRGGRESRPTRSNDRARF